MFCLVLMLTEWCNTKMSALILLWLVLLSEVAHYWRDISSTVYHPGGCSLTSQTSFSCWRCSAPSDDVGKSGQSCKTRRAGPDSKGGEGFQSITFIFLS